MTRGNAGAVTITGGNAVTLYGNGTGTFLQRFMIAAEQSALKIRLSLAQNLSDVLSVHIFFSPSHTFFHSFLHI